MKIKKNKTQREKIWKWMRVTLGQKKPVKKVKCKKET